jgi:hypothetical protein
MRVDYIDDSFIKKQANELIDKYTSGSITDIEGIATQKLGLKIRFIDLQSCYGNGTLGMILQEYKMILCDKSLEPYGKYKETNEHILRFTIAHEIGHYTLHLKYMGDSGSPFFHRNLKNHEKKKLETQANMLAAELLMPEAEFRKAYIHTFYNEKIRPTYDIKSNLSNKFNVSKEAVGYRIQALNL